MVNPRSNFGIEVLDGSVVAVGGFNGFQACSPTQAIKQKSYWQHIDRNVKTVHNRHCKWVISFVQRFWGHRLWISKLWSFLQQYMLNGCVPTSSLSMKPSGALVSEPLHLTNIAGKRSVLWDPQSMSSEPLHKANDPYILFGRSRTVCFMINWDWASNSQR